MQNLMELTIEEALQQAVAAHNSGNVQEAERVYQAILRSQPKHPDANHNLGLIAISANHIEVALPLFKNALDVNPTIEQFWVSYIDALIKQRQFEATKQALGQAKKQGVAGEKLKILEGQLASIHEIDKIGSVSPPPEQLRCLLEHYQKEQFSEAEKLAISISQEFPRHNFSWKILAAVFKKIGRNSEAEFAGKTAVKINAEDAEAHYNLSNTLREMDRLDEAEVSYREALTLRPDYAEAHSNLGITLQELGRLDESEVSLRQAIALQLDFAEAHTNLGNTLKELGRFDAAESSYKQAIVLRSNYAEAHNNLGNLLQELGRLEEAEAMLRQAVVIKPNYAKAHGNLCKVFYQLGYKETALKSIKSANEIDPESKDYKLILSVIKSRKSGLGGEVAVGDRFGIDSFTRLKSNPLKLHRAVDSGLIKKLYEIDSSLKKKVKMDARFGTRSSSFNLFEDSSPMIQTVAADLTRIMVEAIKSEIFIYDSFFNILGAGGGTIPHNHLNDLDRNISFNLGRQKYSLQYYLSVGDQNCAEPGVLKLYEPVEDILPSNGMITIIPANRAHAAVYGGETDRIMIGVNFYSL